MHIHGIIPPIATPMQANEDLDLPRLKWFSDHQIASGVHAVFVLGTNSEFYALDEREKQEVIATAVAHVNKRVPVWAGTGAETTREVVRLTRMAEREGVDGVSVITPYFVSPTQQEIVKTAANATFLIWHAKWQRQNADALKELQEKHGVQILRTPPDILTEFLKTWDKIAAEEAAKNPFFKKVHDSQKAYASMVVPAKRFMFPPYSFAANYYFPEKAAAKAAAKSK